MNPLLTRLMAQYRNAEDDGSSGGGGGGGGGGAATTSESAPDRGDFVAAPATAQAATEKVEVETETKTETEGEGEAATKEADERARDPNTGKFTKKDKGDEALMVPKARFDEAVTKERQAREAAEARAAELESKINKASTAVDIEKLEAEVVSLEEQHTKLIMEGDAKAAAEVMRTIRHKEREIGKATSQLADADRAAREAQENAIKNERERVTEVINKITSEYPEFDENSEQFNGKLVNIVLAEQSRLITEEGFSPSEALRKAADDVMELRGGKTLKDASTESKDAKDVKGERKAEATKKALDAASKQPGSMKDVGMDSDKSGAKAEVDADKLTFEEFNALPEATKAKMRGDFV